LGGLDAILFTTTTFGCSWCDLEASSLAEHQAAWDEEGLSIAVISLTFTDPDGSAATTSGAELWRDTYGLSDAFVVADPERTTVPPSVFFMTPFQSIVNPRTMQVLRTGGWDPTYTSLLEMARAIDTDVPFTVSTPPVDADEDGYFSDIDCDDSDGAIYPGAPELGVDGIDHNCDGMDVPPISPDPETWSCNPMTQEPCDVDGGQACDGFLTIEEDLVVITDFSCFDPPNDAELWDSCDNTEGPWCSAGTTCLSWTSSGSAGYCTEYCTETSDCTPGDESEGDFIACFLGGWGRLPATMGICSSE
jgi:hypothetical protein